MTSIKEVEQSEINNYLETIFKEQLENYVGQYDLAEHEKIIALGSYVTTSNGEQLVGGLIAKQHFNGLHISLLAIDIQYRNQRLGSNLLSAIEKIAKKNDISTITLNTKNYQALDFYLKHGYKIFGELADYPLKDVTKFFLYKRIK